MNEQRYKAIIVEDNPKDLGHLLQLLASMDHNLDVLGTYNNVGEAAIAIKKALPDLIFLDIHIGQENGLNLITLFDDLDFEVIVITSDISKSTEAFELSAIEFIHKPLLDATPIRQVIGRLDRGQIGSFKRRLQTYFHNVAANDDAEKKLTLRKQGKDGPLEVPLKDILRIEASKNYSHVYTTLRPTPELLSRNIGYFEKILPSDLFVKANRSNLVNAYWIRQEKLDEKNQLTLKDDTVISVSPKRWQKLVGDILAATGD